MKTTLEIIASGLDKLASGEAMPSVDSPEYLCLVAAIASATVDDYAHIGGAALVALLCRLVAGMNAECILQGMQDGGDPLHS